MFENLLIRLLQKISDKLGERISTLMLDETAWRKRASVDLFHALRTFEETLHDIQCRLDRSKVHSLNNLDQLTRDPQRQLLDVEIVERLVHSIDSAQNAFSEIDDSIEIYGSRTNMESLRNLLDADSEVMYLLHDNYNNEEFDAEKWNEIMIVTSKCAEEARMIVTEFIRTKFPI